MSDTPNLPGRLGDPSMTLGTDPRADARMIAAMEPLDMTGPPEPAPVDINSPLDELLGYVTEAEIGFGALGGLLSANTPPVTGVERRTEVIRGVDDNDITLYIHAPADADGPRPGILHSHGGGMVMLTAADDGAVRWRDELAAAGLVVVGVEFRNAGGKLGPHPFPAGLDDCSVALDWMYANRDSLGVSHIVLSGESGGGNLAIANAIKANRENRLHQIAGVYAQCPYISGQYADKNPDLPSLWENDGYFLDCSMMGALVRVYSPDGSADTDPLAWPLYAEGDDLAGLPPHVVSVNELDPLRDEGLAFYRKLTRAGVPAASQTVNGTCHAGDGIFLDAMPDVYRRTIGDIATFANSLTP